MRIAVANPAGPRSFARYAQALCSSLSAQGVRLQGSADAHRPHLFWNPYGGWGEAPVWPGSSRTALVVSFHGAAGWSKPLALVYGREPTTAMHNWAQVQRERWEPLLSAANAILVPSRYAQQELLDLFSLKPQRVHVVPLGHDPRLFNAHGPVAEGVGFLHVSAGGPVKRVGLILDAYALLAAPETPLTLVLPQERWPTTVPPGVRLLEPVDNDLDLAALYRGALALLQPSAWETFGLPAVEAAACGTPVIVSANSAPAEIWSDHAFLLQSDQAWELASAMRKMMDPELRRQMTARAMERAQELTWDACAAKTLEVFRRVRYKQRIWHFLPWNKT
ncbi:MAG: glycosyltransferase [Acidithiobacillus sp.]